MTLIGFVLYGSTVLLPLLMQVLLGYTATHAGITNLPRGLASFLIMPIVGRLTGKFDHRKLLAIGLVASAYAMWELSRLSLDVASRNFWWPLMIQGAALGFVFVPLTTITNDPIPNERMGNATSIFNLMRNIGASIGIPWWRRCSSAAAVAHQHPWGTRLSGECDDAADDAKAEGVFHEPGRERGHGDATSI